MQVRSVVQLLRARTADESLPSPRAAYTFIDDEGRPAASTDYPSLDRRARAIGAEVHDALQGRRAPVLLLFAPGLAYVEAFFGGIYGNGIPVPAYPPDPSRLDRTLPRLLSVIENAGAEVVLTTSDIAALAQGMAALAPGLAELRWIAVDAVPSERATSWRDPGLEPDDVCFLQYTSGSTSDPKGVMVTHRSLLANQRMIAAAMGNDHTMVAVSWLPMYHDMGLVGHIIQPLYVGAQSVLMSPLTFLRQPYRWLEAITRYRGTTSGAPNFAFDLCVRKIDDRQLEALDLSTWRLAYSGAEPIREETLSRFAEKFAKVGLRREALFPCYGLAEATLFVSGGPANVAPRSVGVSSRALEAGRVEDAPGGETRSVVSCGRIPQGTDVLIVDPEAMRPAATATIGEIWVRGDHVASGYWRDADTSEHVFRARTANGDGPFLRTGDLGFLREGELTVTGRLRDLIIIGGRNHYPQDIELTVETSHTSLRRGCSAAFTVEVGATSHLIVAVEVERRFRPDSRRDAAPPAEERRRGERRSSDLPPGNEAPAPTRWDSAEIAEVVRRAVWRGHELAVHTVVLVSAGAIPKTSSGKIQRSATRQAFLEGTLDTMAVELASRRTRERRFEPPETAAEELLARIWQEVLGAEQVGRSDTFVELGGDSVKAAQVVWRARERGLELSLQSMFEHPTLRALAASASERVTPPVPRSSSSAPPMALVPTPHELDFLSALPASAVSSVVVRGVGVDAQTLERALRHVVEHHEALESTFIERASGLEKSLGGERLAVMPPVTVSAAAMDAPEQVEALRSELASLISLERGPLLAAALLRVDGAEPASSPTRVVLAMHEVISDDVSWLVLLDDLDRAYRHLESEQAVRLPENVPLSQWTGWIVERARAAPEAALRAWIAQAEVPPALGAAGADGSGEPITVTRSLPDIGDVLEQLARERGVNVLEFLATATLLGLYDVTGEDARIDVFTSGRDSVDHDLSRTIGRLAGVEPLAVRLGSAGGDSLGLVSRHIARLRELDAPFRALAWFHTDDDVRRAASSVRPARLRLRYGDEGNRALALPRLGYCRLAEQAAGPADVADLTGSLSGTTLELRLRFDPELFAPADMTRLLDHCVARATELGSIRADRGTGLIERHRDSSLGGDQLAAAIRKAAAARLKKGT